ncbi:MAG: SH3 domain-containing protein [Oceanococcus sp.]
MKSVGCVFIGLLVACGVSYAQDVNIVNLDVPMVGTAIATTRLNLRAEAKAQSDIVSVFPRGTRLRVLEDRGEFLQVEQVRENLQGFVASAYVMFRPSPSSVREQMPIAIKPDVSERDETGVVELTIAGQEPEPTDQSAATTPEQPPKPMAVLYQPAEFSSAPTAASRWYLSLQSGYAQGDVAAADLQSALQSAAGFAQVRNLDESSLSWGLNLGYAITPIFAAEFSVLDLGTYNSVIEIRNADNAAVRNIVAEQHPVGGAGMRAAIRVAKQYGRWLPSASLGAFQSFDTEIDVTIDGKNQRVEGNDLSVTLDTAIGYRLTSHWSAELEVAYLKLNQAIVKPAIAIRYVP